MKIIGVMHRKGRRRPSANSSSGRPSNNRTSAATTQSASGYNNYHPDDSVDSSATNYSPVHPSSIQSSYGSINSETNLQPHQAPSSPSIYRQIRSDAWLSSELQSSVTNLSYLIYKQNFSSFYGIDLHIYLKKRTIYTKSTLNQKNTIEKIEIRISRII